MATVVEILQSIKQSEMSPMLSRIYKSEGGTEILDVLMKYLCVRSLESCHPASVERHNRYSIDDFLDAITDVHQQI